MQTDLLYVSALCISTSHCAMPRLAYYMLHEGIHIYQGMKYFMKVTCLGAEWTAEYEFLVYKTSCGTTTLHDVGRGAV